MFASYNINAANETPYESTRIALGTDRMSMSRLQNRFAALVKEDNIEGIIELFEDIDVYNYNFGNRYSEDFKAFVADAENPTRKEIPDANSKIGIQFTNFYSLYVSGSIRVLQTLLDIGKLTMISDKDFSLAIKGGNYKFVEYLIHLQKAGDPRVYFDLDGTFFYKRNVESKPPGEGETRSRIRTPLYECIINDTGSEEHFQILQLLVQSGASLSNSILSDRDYHPLAAAIQRDNYKFADYLLQVGIEIEPYCLEVACFKNGGGNVAFIEKLLHRGIDVNSFDDRLMIFVCEKGHLDVVRCLVQHGSIINFRILQTAVTNKQSEITRYLLGNAENLDLSRGTFLTDAVKTGDLPFVVQLLETRTRNNLNVDENNGMPLRMAVRGNRIEMVKMLISYGADINLNNGAALADACDKGFLELVKLFLESPALLASSTERAVFNAIHRGHFDVHCALKSHGYHL